MSNYRPLEAVTNLPYVNGESLAYYPNDVAPAYLSTATGSVVIGLGPYVLCAQAAPEPSAADRTASALERIADTLEGLVSNGGNLKVERP